MQFILISIAVLLLVLWIAGHLIVALLHILGWLFGIIPFIVLGLVIAAIVMHFLARRTN